MKKLNHSKLKLNRESIRILDGESLSRVAGAKPRVTGASNCYDDCLPATYEIGCVPPVLFTDLC